MKQHCTISPLTIVGSASPSLGLMIKYIGVKVLNARPMTRGDYNTFRGWTIPVDENPCDHGYLVEYLDGGKANTVHSPNYLSWSPRDVFEAAYGVVIEPTGPAVALRTLSAHMRADGVLANTWYSALARTCMEAGASHDKAYEHAAKFMQQTFKVNAVQMEPSIATIDGHAPMALKLYQVETLRWCALGDCEHVVVVCDTPAQAVVLAASGFGANTDLLASLIGKASPNMLANTVVCVAYRTKMS